MSEKQSDLSEEASSEVPVGSIGNLGKYFKYDFLSGFLVFLIALPLCLAIANASGYPPIAGIFTAIIGGIVSTLISNSELTIKGPAAGLIVIVIGCVNDFGYTGGENPTADMQAYKIALGVSVVAACIQIAFAVFKTGILGEFFPSAAVHGMLAAIGVIIMAKQIPLAMGVDAKGAPLKLIAEIPQTVMNMNPEIALIGITSLIILFGKPLIKSKVLAKIPAQLIVLVVAIPLGIYFDLTHEHFYSFHGHKFKVDDHYLVQVSEKMFSMFSYITLPDFSGLSTAKGWKWVAMFSLIGSLESLLSAKAVDLIDPWKRKCNLNRDMLAVGVGNLACSLVGGLPMISEIVRSRANIDNGARTRFADMFHSLFLLVCVAVLPMVIHRIPMAALGAMLIYTGFRLAHPREFVHVFKVGPEQLIIYVTTIVAVLATDLLIGIGIGIAVKFLIHAINGVPMRSFFKPYVEVVEENETTYRVLASHSAVFSTWIPLRRQIINTGIAQHKNVIIDLSETKLVDHTVLEKLHELEQDFAREGLSLEVTGLDSHRPLSNHPYSARKKALVNSNSQQ